MSDLQWKIEHHDVMVLVDYVDKPRWRCAEMWECAEIIQSVIASTKEQCARVADAHVGVTAHAIAAAIRSLQITEEGMIWTSWRD